MSAITDYSTLVISCPDQVGLVAAVSTFVAERGGCLVESSNHTDLQQGWFFMRNVIGGSAEFDRSAFEAAFAAIADAHQMSWQLSDNAVPERVVILASHASHCLSDILYRWKSGDLSCAIPCVIANHENLRSMVEWHGIPYFHVPVDPKDKAPAFAEVERLVKEHRADVIVLARYMQILSDEMCQKMSGRIINIHHSFLPSFKGANPYKQAFERGVKLIGATSHYVTADLDEGPIIEQDTVRVTHAQSPSDYVSLGRDVEAQVLARAIHAHIHRRVFLNGNKTVVFPASPGSYASERMG